MTRSSLALSMAAAFALSLVACGNNVNTVLDGSGVHSVTQPIINGLTPSRPEHDAVVGIHLLARGGQAVYVSPFCSATLITDDVALGAAHCFDGQTGNASKIAVYVGDEPAVDVTDHLYEVTELAKHPSFNATFLTDDVALLRLGSSVTEASPVPHYTVDDLVPGQVGNFAGFGQDENGDSGVKLQIDGAIGDCTGNSRCTNEAGQIYYEQAAGGPCFGDSGGPWFTYSDINTYASPSVAGITSYGDSNCAEYGVSTKVSAYASFIDAFLNPSTPDCSADGVCNAECPAGDDPDCGGGQCTDGLPVGASCDADAECCSNKCKGKPGNKTCK